MKIDVQDFCLDLRSNFDPWVLRPDLMGLKRTNSRGECMIRLLVYMGLGECIWVSLGSFFI